MQTVLDYANKYITPIWVKHPNRLNSVLEADSDVKEEEHFKMELLDVNAFIKSNNIQEITDPIFFVKNNQPTSGGLLSNEIFGIDKDARSNIFGYIDLHETFIHPLCYKLLCRMDKNFKECVHGTKSFSLDENGYLVEDENGKNGIKFLKDNINKLKIRHTESRKRDTKIKFIEANKDKMFMDKYIVIPAFYRDVTTSKGYVAVGEINKMYQSLIIAVRALSESKEYGFDISGATRGRVQETILAIYDWFIGNSNSTIKEEGTGISGKFGILQTAALSKTTDYSSRLVISAPNLKVESMEDMIVDMDHCLLPLSAALTNFYPFILFNVRLFFQNEFSNEQGYPILNQKTGKITYEKLKDPLIEFSDERIAEEINRYVKGYSNRFIPVEVTLEDGRKIPLGFKGHYQKVNDNIDQIDRIPEVLDQNKTTIGRRLTWLDVLYMAACKSVEDKNVIITRYPMDSCYNQTVLKPVISSTNETEPIYYDNEYYRIYPKIREEDIGTNTSNKFIETLNISNLILPGIAGDYDGDQVSVKGIYTVEANKELDAFRASKANYVTMGATNIRKSEKEAVNAVYNMTLVLPGTKLTPME